MRRRVSLSQQFADLASESHSHYWMHRGPFHPPAMGFTCFNGPGRLNNRALAPRPPCSERSRLKIKGQLSGLWHLPGFMDGL